MAGFPLTINGHTYTFDGVTSGQYAFDGYGWTTALANLNADQVTVAGNVVTSAGTASSAATAAGNSATTASNAATAAGNSATAAAASAVTAALQAAGLTSTSTTTLTPQVLSKTFTTQASKSFSANQYVFAVSASDATVWMYGQVTSYSGTTLIIDSQVIGVASSKSDWTISISAIRGLQGATGAPGSFLPVVTATGTVDAILADYSPDLTLTNLVACAFVSTGANATTTPTFAPDGLTAHTITARGGAALVAGDIGPAGFVGLLEYNSAGTRWELMNPVGGTAAKAATGTSGHTLGYLDGANTWSATQAFGTVTATTWNGNTITTGTGVLTIAAGKTLTVSNTMTMTGTDGQSYGHPAASDTMAGLATVQTFSKAQRGAFVALTDASTIAIDLSLANQFRVVLGGNRTLGVPTNAVEGQQGIIKCRQDPTGSRVLSYTWIWQIGGGTAGVMATPGCSSNMLAYSVDVYQTSAVTITIAAPGVITWNAHGLDNGQPIQLTTTGALPTGLAANTTYWITNQSANAFSLSTTLPNAAAGTKITTTGSQSGTHTMVAGTITYSVGGAIS